MKKKLLQERYESAKLYLENRRSMKLEMGTDEYSKILEKIINDLKTVKNSLRTRSKEGARHRKESDRIQAAINAMKYLNNKNKRMVNDSIMKEGSLTRDDIKSFLRKFK